MDKINTYEDLRSAVEANGDILTVATGMLRDIHGVNRLGVHVRSNISNELAGLGLAHFPEELPDRQHAYATIYKQGSPIAKLINAVANPNPDTDTLLRNTVKQGNSKILDRIRELLDEEG